MSTKIGTITFQASHNCGSLLQAYALQQTLKAMGYDNEIINFSNEGSRDMYSITDSSFQKRYSGTFTKLDKKCPVLRYPQKATRIL